VLTLISEAKYKTLNAVLFGEGVTNDAVSILLFRAVYGVIIESQKGTLEVSDDAFSLSSA